MSDQTGIEWTDATWNPIRGCSRVSAGCMHCYAERQAIRQIKSGYAGLIQRTSHGPAWTGEVRLVPELLDAPLRWRSPRRVFVNSMSDLFHEKVSDAAIERILTVTIHAKAHTFQILTKRPERMRSVMQRWADMNGRPQPNLWLGVSVEDQATADERIPLLLETPAAVRFVSYEPALGPVDFDPLWLRASPSSAFQSGRVTPEMPAWTRIGAYALDWVIVGGESGPKARPCDVAWIRTAVEQCKAADVACFVKQLGARPMHSLRACDGFTDDGQRTYADLPPAQMELADRKGGDPAEWPADLRVREMPR